MGKTYDAVTYAAAYMASQEGRDKHTAKDELTIAKRYQLIRQFGAEIRRNEELIAKTGRDRLNRHADLINDRIKLGKYLDNVLEGREKIDRRAVATQIRQIEQKLRRETGAYDEPDMAHIDQAKKNMNSERYGKNLSVNQAMFRAMIDTDPFGDQSYVDYSKPSLLAAQERLFREFDEVQPGILQIDENGIITNEKELLSLTDSPLVESGLLDEGVHAGLYSGPLAESNAITRYNDSRRKYLTSRSTLQSELDRLNTAANDIETEEDADDAIDRLRYVVDRSDVVWNAAETAIGSDLSDLEEVNRKLADITQIEADNRALRADQQRLRSEIAGGGAGASSAESALAEDKRQRATAISSPWWREWAADHGFDELGRADLNEDGTVNPDSYIAGRDDVAAFKAFNREQKRGAGRYGFQSIGTGTIVRVNIDGETIVGERLKYHAADRPGSFRIIVPGEVEPIMVNPGDVDEVFIVESDPQKVSPLAKKAKRRLRRGMGDRIEAATQKVSDSAIDIGDAAEFKGEFVTTKDGRHLTDAELNERIDGKTKENWVVAKLVGDQTYYESADGTILAPLPDGTYAEYHESVDDDEDTLKLIATVREAPGRAVSVGKVVDGEFVPVGPATYGDVNTEDSILAYGPVEGEEGYTDEHSLDTYNRKLRDRTIESISLDELNLTGTSEFKPYEPPPVGESRSIGGFKFTDLTKDPEGVRIASPSEPPAVIGDPVDVPASTEEPLPVKELKPRRVIKPETKDPADPVMDTIEAAVDAYDEKPPTAEEAKAAEAEIQAGVPSESELYSQMLQPGTEPQPYTEPETETKTKPKADSAKDDTLSLEGVDLDAIAKGPPDEPTDALDQMTEDQMKAGTLGSVPSEKPDQLFDLSALEESLKAASPEQRKQLLAGARAEIKSQMEAAGIAPAKSRRLARKEARKAKRDQIAKAKFDRERDPNIVSAYMPESIPQPQGLPKVDDDPKSESKLSQNIVPGESASP